MNEMAEEIVDALIERAMNGSVTAIKALERLELKSDDVVREDRPSLTKTLWDEFTKRKAEKAE